MSQNYRSQQEWKVYGALPRVGFMYWAYLGQAVVLDSARRSPEVPSVHR